MAQFYLDENVALQLAPQLQLLGHQVVTVRGLQRAGVEDEDLLLEAAQQHWIFVTHNRRDFILLHRAWLRWTHVWGVSAQHSGILVIPQEWLPPRAAGELQAFMLTSPHLTNQIYEWRQSAWVTP